MKKNIVLLFAGALLLAVSSCSKYNKLLKSTDYEAKYNAAVHYYNEKKFFQALQLFEELVTVFKGTAKAEITYYYFAKSYYETGDYLTAAYHLSNFAKTFPASERAEECQFLNAYCYFLDSPSYTLDQASTLDAIKQFQLFINKFPKSKRVEECNRLIDQLRLKLESKAFANAKLYYRMNEYRAATIAFGNVVKDFPATQYKEECLYLQVKSSFRYAERSIESKKAERHKETIEHYFKLLDTFPESKYLKECEDLFNESKKALGKLEKDKSVTLQSP